MYLLKDYITARAQLVTFILFIFEIYLIEQFIEKNKKRYLAYLILDKVLSIIRFCFWEIIKQKNTIISENNSLKSQLNISLEKEKNLINNII